MNLRARHLNRISDNPLHACADCVSETRKLLRTVFFRSCAEEHGVQFPNLEHHHLIFVDSMDRGILCANLLIENDFRRTLSILLLKTNRSCWHEPLGDILEKNYRQKRSLGMTMLRVSILNLWLISRRKWWYLGKCLCSYFCGCLFKGSEMLVVWWSMSSGTHEQWMTLKLLCDLHTIFLKGHVNRQLRRTAAVLEIQRRSVVYKDKNPGWIPAAKTR